MVVVDTNANCTKFQIWKNSFDMMDFLVTNILLNHYFRVVLVMLQMVVMMMGIDQVEDVLLQILHIPAYTLIFLYEPALHDLRDFWWWQT